MKARYLLSRDFVFAAVLISMLVFSKPATANVNGGKASHLLEEYGKIPLSFVPNEGQTDPRVKFYESSGGHETFFTNDGIVFAITAPDQELLQGPSSFREEEPQPQAANSHLVKLTPLGMRRDVLISADEPQTGRVNYFIGDVPEKWRRDIPTYRSVLYGEAYPGVDFKFYGNNRHLEYDIIVKPGGDLSQVKLQYTGIDHLQITDKGDLTIQVREGLVMAQRAPVVYQVIDGKRVDLAGNFCLKSRTNDAPSSSISLSGCEGRPEAVRSSPSKGDDQPYVVGFEVASYDKKYPLIIDPILIYSSYLGGTGSDYGYALAVDAASNVYLTGCTLSVDFPTKEPFHGPYTSAYAKVFITKLDAAGTALVYSTYLGGNGRNYGYGIALDATGSAYVAGYTTSTNFPRKNAIQKARGGDYDAFVTKLGPAGNALVYSTYLGGSARDGATSIAVDSAGNAFITGRTSSKNFPLMKPFQAVFAGGESDAFVAKLDVSGKPLIYSSYLGGSDLDGGTAIAVDSSGNAYITGVTRSANFLLENPFQNDRQGIEDAFVLKMNPLGDALVYSTYLGGTDLDEGKGIAVDVTGSAYVTGATRSQDFPVMNPIPNHGQNAGYYDAFVTKLTPAGSALAYSTYLGGKATDYGSGIAVDAAFNVYVSGYTTSVDFPLVKAFQSQQVGVWDAFVAKLEAAGNTLVYSSYLGGSKDDYARAIAVDASGYAYVTGWTHSDDFLVTPAALQPTKAGEWDAFVTKLNNTNFVPAVADFSAKPLRGVAPLAVKFANASKGDISTWQWDFGDGQTSSKKSLTHAYANPGKYAVSLTVSGPGGSSTKVRTDYITVETLPAISVVAPNGGEIWPQGTTQTIKWSYQGSPGSVVRIELLMGGAAVSTLSASSPIGTGGTGSYSWKVPLSRVPAENYRISITTGKDVSDASDDNFTIGVSD